MEEHIRIHLDTNIGGDAVKKQAASFGERIQGLCSSARSGCGSGRAQPHEGVHERT